MTTTTTTNYSIKNVGILCLLLTTILCSWEPLAYKASNFKNKLQAKSASKQKDDLEIALEKASMANKTVIITIINKAYVEAAEGDEYPSMLDLFFEGFWVGENTRPLVGHVLVVSMDQTAHERCEFRRLNCYNLAAHDGGGGDRFARETIYMSDEFIEMMWRRTLFLVDVLKRGYNFIFTDTDILWLRNPFTRLMKKESMDLQISTDLYNTSYLHVFINTGFYFVRSNNKTTSLFQTWYDLRKNLKGMKEQDVMSALIRRGYLEKLKLNVEFLETEYFSGFCRDSHDIKSVVTVHANCCITVKAKIIDLKVVLRDWKRGKNEEKNNSRNSTTSFKWTKHEACTNAWNHKST